MRALIEKMERTAIDRVKIEGFPFHIIRARNTDCGDDVDTAECPGPVWTAKIIGLLSAGLRRYKKRAQALYPRMLKMGVGFVYQSKTGWGQTASYNAHAKDITFTPALFSHGGDNPRNVAHLIAHEMGHHIVQAVMTNADKKLWHRTIIRPKATIDVRDALAYSDGAKGKVHEKPWDTSEAFKRGDPILFMQVQGMRVRKDPHPFIGKPAYVVHGMIKGLDNYGNKIEKVSPHVDVQAKPITAYANTSPEEAFVEAFGMLIGHGPRAVLPEVRQVLRIILPGLKINESDEATANLVERLEVFV